MVEVVECDYAVVGAGSAGCVVADRLSADGWKVVLLEAGPRDWHPMIHIPAGILHLLHNPRINRQERYADAEPLHKRAFVVRVKTLGPDHPDVALSINNLASLYAAQDRFDWAEPLFQRSLKISEKSLDEGHPWLATTLRSLARLAVSGADYERAVAYLRRATAILSRRAEHGISDGSRVWTKREVLRKRLTCESLIKTTYRLAADEPAKRQQHAIQMFKAAQWG